MGSSLPELVSSRLVSPRMDRPVNTLFWLTLWVSNSSSSESTRWTLPNHHTLVLVSMKSPRKSNLSSRRSDTIPQLLPLSPFPDGMATTCWNPPPTCPGTRDGKSPARKEMPRVPPFWKLWTLLSHLNVPQTNPFVSPFKMFTKSVVLEQCPSVVSKLVSSNPVWLSLSLLTNCPLRLSQLKCTTKLCPKPFPETMSDSTSRTSLSRILSVDTSPLTPRTNPLLAPRTSLLRSLSLTILDKSATDTLQSWIATLLTLLANLTKSRRRSIVVPERLLRPTPNLSNLEMLLLLS